jgi:hypothetical protein
VVVGLQTDYCIDATIKCGFDGVTIAEFDADMKIFELKEFQSNAEHWYPYGNDKKGRSLSIICGIVYISQ